MISKGAEADIYSSKWLGNDVIIKIREKKNYRNPELDSRLRKSRTIKESEIIHKAKSLGVPTPLIYYVDLEDSKIIMQKISGNALSSMSNKKIINSCKEVGRLVGILHKNGIMHGDLTTSNFLITKETMYVIDFGLAQLTSKEEDLAVDLRLIKEILNSAHAKIMEQAWANFLHGYSKVVGKSKSTNILHQVSIIESRGRYAEVV